MVNAEKLGFITFVLLISVFFILPDPETFQKPFRIGLALFFAYTLLILVLDQQINIKTLIPVLLTGAVIAIIFNRGMFQSSLINAWLCLGGLLILPKLSFRLTANRTFDLNLIHFICMVAIILQFLFFSSADGRPSLGYEINLSGAYLFLFFLFSEALDRKDGKILVIALSFLLLSRLLLFSILLFYIIRYTKNYWPNVIARIKFPVIALVAYVLISLFSVWYVATVTYDVSYETGFSRLFKLNDGSNQWRFLTNTLVMAKIYLAPFDPNILFGFGPIENFLKATKGALIMPHNELYDAIVEFGLITVLLFGVFTMAIYNKFINFSNLEIVLPLLFYTLILWVRFFIIPSFEMLFILFILTIVNGKNNTLEKETGTALNLLSCR